MIIQKFTLDPEQIAYWFFRLNGCLTIPNFVVHPNQSGSQRTEVDIMAVRFPHRTELLTSGASMVDHPIFQSEGLIDIIIAEAKHSQCRLNGPWTNPADENMQRVLYAMGAVPIEKVPVVAQALYEKAFYRDATYRMRLVSIGEVKNPLMLPGAVQLTWEEVRLFIYNRLSSYQLVKSHHPQWDLTGQRLFRMATTLPQEEFTSQVRVAMQRYVDKTSTRQRYKKVSP